MEVAELAPIEHRRDNIVAEVEDFYILNNTDYELAGETIKGIKVLLKEIENTFSPIAKKQYDAWKETKAQQARFETPLLEADKNLRNKMGVFKARMEAEAAAQRRAIEEQAREAERQRLAFEAAQAAAIAAAAPPPPPPPPLKPIVATVAIAKEIDNISYYDAWTYVWSGEPLDPDYCKPDDKGFPVPDHGRIRGMVVKQKDKCKITGVTVQCKQTLRVT